MIPTKYTFKPIAWIWLRVYAALSIILGHSTHWLSAPDSVMVRVFNIFPGLIIFFAMSGFLITASMERGLPSWRLFLWRRFVRLYPGMWVCFLVSLIVVAEMTHIYGIEVSAWSWVKWIGAQLTFFQFYTPQDLKAYGIGNPNGVLWMIPLMLCMYVLMRFAYPRLRKAGAAVWLCLLAALIAVAAGAYWCYPVLPLLWQKLVFVSILPYMYIFFLAMLLCHFKARVLPVLCRWWWVLVLLFVVWVKCKDLWNIHMPGLYLDIFSGCLVCILSIAVAYRFRLPRFKHDYSYSLFLYHEIFINLFVVLGYTHTWYAVLYVFVGAIVCAVISCRLVEEPSAQWLKSLPASA